MKLSEIQVADRVAQYEKIDVAKKEVATSTIREEKNVEVAKQIETNDKKVQESVEKINKHLEASNTRIKFKIHESDNSLNNKVSIKVIDEESEKVIAEIPSEEAIELSERMEKIIGFLFDASK